MRAENITIESSGLLSTIQDAGRNGYQRYGMPVSGAMDVFSLQLANSLVGNLPGEACIEATLAGPSIRFGSSATIAVCGADMQAFLNQNRVQNNIAIEACKGDLLHFAGLRSGCRDYIAFSGGLNIAPAMGSKSTYLRSATGGFEGRALKNGDILELGHVRQNPKIKTIPDELKIDYKSEEPVRIIPGPEINMFGFEAIRNLLTTTFLVSSQSDRMGYRLQGEPLKHLTGKADIISSGIPVGTIQVPGDGQPIIMMADRQTTGGYARIAVVASIDLTRVAQLKPGDKIRFREIGIEEAQQLYRKRQKLIEELFGGSLNL
jgi:biotin-dependent carboxylase-like uncharacterized protein